jgi:hypothetical protein
MTDKRQEADKAKIHDDAKGQFAGTQAGGDSDGVASAKPTVVTGSEDATVNKWPPGKEDKPKDWNSNFDIREQANRR